MQMEKTKSTKVCTVTGTMVRYIDIPYATPDLKFQKDLFWNRSIVVKASMLYSQGFNGIVPYKNMWHILKL